MKEYINPFITSGYVSPEYFCDREDETKQLQRELRNGNNVALISTRRMGKTGLIRHVYHQPVIQKNYHTFFVDIYATKSLRDFVFALSKDILSELKPLGKKAIETFWRSVKSLQACITFDVTGVPSFNLGLGDIQTSEVTLSEIFSYLNKAGKPCIVAIDEFQQIAGYAEENIEALLRTYVQQSKNVQFIFAGSQRHAMGNMFLSASRPFYQSVSMMHLESIAKEKYCDFAVEHFKQAGKKITAEAVAVVYDTFDGVTWYLQKVLNTLFAITPKNVTCTAAVIPEAIRTIVNSYSYAYSETLFRLPEKQKELLIAINKEGRASLLTSSYFIKKYNLTSSSSVQAALRALLVKDFITQEQGEYQTYDKFFGIWLQQNF